MFKGSMVALVTPFRDGGVCMATLDRLVEFHVTAGTDVLVPCGTTGESPTLSHKEHESVIDRVCRTAAGRIPVIAGTGSNSTAEAVRMTKAAKASGAAGSLQVCPYYNKPTQEGLFRHFMAVADAVDIPIVLYYIPGRSVITIEPETIARLCEANPNFVAVKFASSDMNTASRIKELCEIDLLSGDDSLTLPLAAIGSVGVISVAANVIPKQMKAFCRTIASRDFDTALDWHRKLFGLFRSLFLETNPIPVKTAAGLMGICPEEMRLPLSPMSKANKQKLRSVLDQMGLLK